MMYKILIADDKGSCFAYLQDMLKEDTDRFEIVQTARNEIYRSAVKNKPNIILLGAESLTINGIEIKDLIGGAEVNRLTIKYDLRTIESCPRCKKNPCKPARYKGFCFFKWISSGTINSYERK